MPQKKKIDNKVLIKAVESGTTRTEIMAQFGFKTRGQVTTHYLDSLVEVGRAKGIVGRQPTAKPGKALKVNQRGSLIIPKEMVEELGYKVGDTFSVSRALAGD
jgi:hypothetical protein